MVLVGLAAFYFTHDKRFPWQAARRAPTTYAEPPDDARSEPQMMQGQNPMMMQGQNPQMMQAEPHDDAGSEPQMMQKNKCSRSDMQQNGMQMQQNDMQQADATEQMQQNGMQMGNVPECYGLTNQGGDFVAYDNPMHSAPGGAAQFSQAQADVGAVVDDRMANLRG